MNADWMRGKGMDDKCKNCKYWKFGNGKNMNGNGDGLCRRYPPALDPNYDKYDAEGATESSTWCQHPITSEDDWCGEFQRE